jgi:hypothetical protein
VAWACEREALFASLSKRGQGGVGASSVLALVAHLPIN